MIKYSSQFGNLTKQENVERAVEFRLLPLSKKMRQANECDSEVERRFSENSEEAYEDKERGSNRVTVESELDEESKEEEGKRGQGKKQSRGGIERTVASGHFCVCVEGRGAWMAARGMCSLNQESLGAKAKQSTSLPREGESWTEQALLFLPAPSSMHGKRTGPSDMSFITDEIKSESRIDHFLWVK